MKRTTQVQLKLPFEPFGLHNEVEVDVIPFDIRASKHLTQHSKGLVDIPELVEEMPVKISVGPDLSELFDEEGL